MVFYFLSLQLLDLPACDLIFLLLRVHRAGCPSMLGLWHFQVLLSLKWRCEHLCERLCVFPVACQSPCLCRTRPSRETGQARGSELSIQRERATLLVFDIVPFLIQTVASLWLEMWSDFLELVCLCILSDLDFTFSQ